MEIKGRISSLLERWFIQEPALFQVMCCHEIVENPTIACPIRCGKRRVEYCPQLVENMTAAALEEAMRTEAIRLLLKHPYERKPDQCSDQAIAVGSNVTIGDNYKYSSFNIDKPSDYDLDSGMPYEWYSRRIQELLPPSAQGDGGYASDNSGSGSSVGGSNSTDPRTEKLASNSSANSDLSGLWEEDELAITMIDGVISNIKDWGTLAGAMAEKLQASTKAKINWRNIFSGFRASVLSSARHLTRMRPNRRSGFEQMGSTREYTTKLLVAVDVSGSVSSQSLSYFYGVINSAFRYGFAAIDVIQFDHGVRLVQSLKHKMKDVVIVGRGGTDFQEPIDYAVKENYDGLVILTDGYAPEPVIPAVSRLKILWVCEDSKSFEVHHKWMEKSGRVCTIQLK